MSILSDAWRRARGEEDAVTRALGAPPAQSPARRGHWLPWLLCCLLLVVVVGMGVYLWRSHWLSRSRPQTVPGAVAAKPAGAGVARVKSKTPAAAAASHVVAARTPAKAGASAARSTAALASPATSAPDAVRAQLPQLTVTVHVWNPRPAARFVIVNGRIYHEGDELQPGLRLVSITPEGEIIEFRGYRITLDGH